MAGTAAHGIFPCGGWKGPCVRHSQETIAGGPAGAVSWAATTTAETDAAGGRLLLYSRLQLFVLGGVSLFSRAKAARSGPIAGGPSPSRFSRPSLSSAGIDCCTRSFLPGQSSLRKIVLLGTFSVTSLRRASIGAREIAAFGRLQDKAHARDRSAHACRSFAFSRLVVSFVRLRSYTPVRTMGESMRRDPGVASFVGVDFVASRNSLRESRRGH